MLISEHGPFSSHKVNKTMKLKGRIPALIAAAFFCTTLGSVFYSEYTFADPRLIVASTICTNATVPKSPRMQDACNAVPDCKRKGYKRCVRVREDDLQAVSNIDSYCRMSVSGPAGDSALNEDYQFCVQFRHTIMGICRSLITKTSIYRTVGAIEWRRKARAFCNLPSVGTFDLP